MLPQAVIVDVDGVLTDTASRHERAWKALFDDVLAARGGRRPFTHDDYLRHVDGKPRQDGLRAFLASRGLALDDAEVARLAERKDRLFQQILADEGVPAFEDARRQLVRWREQGLRIAAASSSRNMKHILASAGLRPLVQAEVDGWDIDRLHLAGKPAPDLFAEAARRLGVAPEDALLVEDAVAGVEAGRRGGFGLVAGVARAGADPERLRAAGADRVVGRLTDLEAVTGRIRRATELLPASTALAARLAGRDPVVLLDYDGTLTPIVADPEQALLPDATREVVRALADRCPVAIVSGRDRRRLERFVGLGGLWYAGSHGFDIRGPDGRELVHPLGLAAQPALDVAEEALRHRLAAIPGALVERKRFGVAVHWRMVAPERADEVQRAAREEAARHPELRPTSGRKVTELRPAADWDKGRAVGWLLDTITRPDAAALYVGDDLTDEDAFLALPADGIGVLVGRPDRVTAATLQVADPDEVREMLGALASR